MERNKIEKLCEWAYHKGRVGALEGVIEFLDYNFKKEQLDRIFKLQLKEEKEKLQELDNGV